MAKADVLYATGKRKKAIARTWIKPGKGVIRVNDRSVEGYFGMGNARTVLLQPLIVTETSDLLDINVKVHGGGISGQAGAVRHGITKALILYDSELRIPLKKAGFVTRDSRIKERKKYGQRGARARFQFSKR